MLDTIKKIIKHTFVLSSLMIAFIALIMAFCGAFDVPQAHVIVPDRAEAEATPPAAHSAAPLALARHITPSEGSPAAEP